MPSIGSEPRLPCGARAQEADGYRLRIASTGSHAMAGSHLDGFMEAMMPRLHDASSTHLPPRCRQSGNTAQLRHAAEDGSWSRKLGGLSFLFPLLKDRRGQRLSSCQTVRWFERALIQARRPQWLLRTNAESRTISQRSLLGAEAKQPYPLKLLPNAPSMGSRMNVHIWCSLPVSCRSWVHVWRL